MRAQSPVGFWSKIQGLTSRLVLISNDTCLDPRNGTMFPHDHKFLREKWKGENRQDAKNAKRNRKTTLIVLGVLASWRFT
jgi:hypothetical protein